VRGGVGKRQKIVKDQLDSLIECERSPKAVLKISEVIGPVAGVEIILKMVLKDGRKSMKKR
jgi:hypothetical protein